VPAGAAHHGHDDLRRRIPPAPTRALRKGGLLRAIARLDLAYLRAHAFKGTCPTAYDGVESVYSFRGFHHRIARCTYDLRHVRAVGVADRLLAQLKRR
jgi:hypothetical protein